MHRLSCFLVAAMIIGFTADVAPAQIGRGRILKKIRDDLFGTPEERAKEEAARKAAIQKKRQEAERQRQLEAQRRGQGRQPTPIRSQQTRPNTQQQRNPLAAPEVPRSRAENRGPAKNGFGFAVKEKDDSIVITKISDRGNADEAGLRRGDVIVGIGGIEIDSKKAFDEIAEILNPGDTIEIAYKRGNKTNEVQVGYGEPPQVDDEPQTADLLAPASDRRGDFAPSRGSSVLDQESAARQIDQLNRTVIEQQRVIEELQNQIRQMQQTGAQGSIAPPNRSSNSILQTPSSSRRRNR